MADKKCFDADGDYSRYLQMSDLGSHLHSASSGPEARHVPPAAHQLQARPAPTIDDAGHHQAPAAFDFLSLTIGGPHHRAPTTVDVRPPQMPAPEQAAHGFRGATLVQGSGAGGSSWINGMLARNVIRPPASLSLYDQIINDRKEELTAPARRFETGKAVAGAVAEFDVSQGHGQQGCTKSRTLQEVLHESENNDKTHFTLHVSDQGQSQPAIIDSMRVDVDGHTQRGDSLYHHLSKRMHEWVHSFKASCRVETMKNDNSGRLKDTSPDFCATNCANISAPSQNNDAQKEVEVGMLKKTPSAPAGNAEEAAYDSSQPDAAVDIPEAFDWAGFHPVILESSLVPEYDGASGTSATMYPNLRDKLREREQARHSKLSTDGASKISKKKMSKKGKEDCTKDSILSSASFKLLCSKDKTFRKHSSRINDLNRRIIILEETATTAGSSRQFFIKQKMERYKQENAQLLDTIKKGLQQSEKDNNGAGPSGY